MILKRDPWANIKPSKPPKPYKPLSYSIESTLNSVEKKILNERAE